MSIRGLASLAPGKPVEVVIHKPGGKTVAIRCNHSMTEEQIGWFKAGSALNALSEGSRSQTRRGDGIEREFRRGRAWG